MRTIKLFSLISVLTIFLFAFGCASTPRYTESEWIKRLPPPETIEKAKAMALVQTAKTKAEADYASMAAIDKVRIICIVGFCLSIAAIALKQTLFGGAGLFACLGGFCLTYAATEYAKYLGILGLFISVLGAGYAAVVIWWALKDKIKGDGKEHRTTPKLVKKIGEKLEKKAKKYVRDS